MTTPTPPKHSKDRFERSINKFRVMHLLLAEAFDAWRVVPRMFLALYGAMLWWLVKWFTTTRTIEKISCDKDLIIALADKHLSIEQMQSLACTVTDVIHVTAPDTAHTVFATTVAGLATAVFAFYTTSAKDWSKGIGWWKLKGDDVVKTDEPTPQPKVEETTDENTEEDPKP